MKVIDWAWWLDSLGTTPDPGLVYLQESAKAAWDFTAIAGYETDVLTQPVTDISGNGHNFVPSSGSPLLLFTNAGLDGATCYTPPGYLNTYNLGNTLEIPAASITSFFSSDFELLILMNMNQGSIGATTQPILMVENTSNNHKINVYQNQNFLIFQLRVGGSTIQAVNTLASGPTGLILLRFRLNFTADVGNLFINGVQTADVFSSMTVNPATFNPNLKGHLGVYNLNGAASGTGLSSRNHSILKMAVTPLLSAQEALDVQNYYFSTFTRTY